MTRKRVAKAVDPSDEAGRELDDDYAKKRVVKANLPEIVAQEGPDPFKQGPEVFKTMVGLSDTVKKRATRQLQKVHTGQGGATSKKEEDETIVDGYNFFGVVNPPFNLDYLSRLYQEGSEYHYAAVDAKVANIVGLGYDLVDSHKTRHIMDKLSGNEAKTKKKRQQLQELKDKVFDWLDACNDEDIFDDILTNVYTDYEATGNGYFEIGRTANGAVGYIGHIPAVSMRVRKERDGFVQIMGNKAVYFRHFGKDTPNPLDGGDANPNEVIHIKKYSPVNSYYGIPDIIAAMQAVAGNDLAAKFNLDYFENKAVPRHIVVIKGGGLSLGSQTSIAEFFEQSLKGQHHRSLVVPLPADSQEQKTSFEIKAVEAGTQDASFVNYHKINVQAILTAEKVPLTKVGLAEGVNLAVARDADKTFKEQVCRPAQRVLEKKLSKIFAEKTDAFRFKLNELTLTDEDTQSGIDERYLRMQTITPNEVRARWGWAGIEGGDKVVDLKAEAGAEAAATGNRTRDAARSAGATDSKGEGRNAKGEGRKTE